MVSPMHPSHVMATHLDHHIDFDAEFSRRIVRHEQQLKWSLFAFAIAVMVVAAIWAMFVRYI